MKHVEVCLSAREIEKPVFTAVEALLGCRKPVYMRERPDNAILTFEEVL